MSDRIYLSPPELAPTDREAVTRALESGWIAPLGPEVDAFEAELAVATDRESAAALSSGTAALHLALILLGVGPGEKVLVSSMTFAATLNAITYVGAEPVLIDSNRESWNMDPVLLTEALGADEYAACIPVDLYGQCADYDAILPLCAERSLPVVADAAESLGASYRGKPAGSFGVMAALSFNGNKIVTTSGGGALITDDPEWAQKARWLASQARESAPHYQHSTVGYNYRLSNVLAALGRSQLADLQRRVEARRAHNAHYRQSLGSLPGVEFMPEATGARSTFWLSCLTIDPDRAGVTREQVRLHLESLDIESRPLWKPMHMQPLFAGAKMFGGSVAERLFENGLCLPSGSGMTAAQRDRVVEALLAAFEAA